MLMKNGQTEAFGLVVLEAQWAGLPVVAFSSGGVPEALNDGETGLLVEEGNHVSFADAICRLIDDQSLFNQMAAAAPLFVEENFDAAKQNKELEAIYNSVL
jgi:glycosyltransferase involved in cell wall biosynthesis